MGHDAGNRFGVLYRHTIHDQFLANMLIYHFERPKRGDVIVFLAPKRADWQEVHRRKMIFIKRLIGLPGDTVRIKQDANGAERLWINGKPLTEPYIKAPMRVLPNTKYAVNGPLKLGPDQYFVLGDNRNLSYDSRFWGPFKGWRILGKAIFIFSPPQRVGWIH